jgi:WD40 repeat protein
VLAEVPVYKTAAGAAFSPDGKLIATYSHDRNIRIWSVPKSWTAKK